MNDCASYGRTSSSGVSRALVSGAMVVARIGSYSLGHLTWKGPARAPEPGALDFAQMPAYHPAMTGFRIALLVLAVIHALFVGLTSLAGAFADGGDVWQRLLLVLLHPLGAAGVLLLVLVPRLTTTSILATAAILLANAIADLALAQRIAAGAAKGDWELGLAFSVVPVIGIAYALSRLRASCPGAG